MPGGDILMKIMEPEHQVELPDVAAAFDEKRNVVPLLLSEPSEAAICSFIPIVETDPLANS
jgi:hypothetical protein